MEIKKGAAGIGDAPGSQICGFFPSALCALPSSPPPGCRRLHRASPALLCTFLLPLFLSTRPLFFLVNLRLAAKFYLLRKSLPPTLF